VAEAGLVGEARAILGKDDFLKLLMTRLKYQNPLSPRADEDFLGQLAHFTAMEQMINLNDQFAELKTILTETLGGTLQGEALNMLGTFVKANHPDEEDRTIEGMVTKIRFEEGVPKITVMTEVEEIEVGMEDILEVSIY
jgi:flagellar basal-body rod modification protein FlgD